MLFYRILICFLAKFREIISPPIFPQQTSSQKGLKKYQVIMRIELIKFSFFFSRDIEEDRGMIRLWKERDSLLTKIEEPRKKCKVFFRVIHLLQFDSHSTILLKGVCIGGEVGGIIGSEFVDLHHHKSLKIRRDR